MRSVIIYTYYKSSVANYNLAFFIKKELTYKPNIDYIIVINGYEYHNNLKFPKLSNLTILRRENSGYDFSGHAHALRHLNIIKKSYDYYFFLNSRVIGPFSRISHTNWTEFFINKINDRVKLVGTTIVCLPKSDLGGYGKR